jgi:hypothetical protein
MKREERESQGKFDETGKRNAKYVQSMLNLLSYRV